MDLKDFYHVSWLNVYNGCQVSYGAIQLEHRVEDKCR